MFSGVRPGQILGVTSASQPLPCLARPLRHSLRHRNVIAAASERKRSSRVCLTASSRPRTCLSLTPLLVHLLQAKPSEPQAEGTPLSSLPYGEALLQREYELWQRQNEMLDRLVAVHEADRARWEADRAALVAQEARLQGELAELRLQLLFVLSKLGEAGVQTGGGRQQLRDTGDSSSSVKGHAPPPPLQPPVLGSSGSSVALPETINSSSISMPTLGTQQVRAAIEAMRAGSGTVAAPPPSEYPLRVFAERKSDASAQTLPAVEQSSCAADVLAALAAVDEADVLDDVALRAEMDRWRARASGEDVTANSTAAAPAPLQAAESPSPLASHPEPEPVAAAAAAQGATAEGLPQDVPSTSAGPPPMLVVGADDIFWVNQLHMGLMEAG